MCPIILSDIFPFIQPYAHARQTLYLEGLKNLKQRILPIYLIFNAADKLNGLLLEALLSSGQLDTQADYTLDFDHEFLQAEKYDAKNTYKHFKGYGPGVATIGELIVGIENHDGNANVRSINKIL